MELELDIKESAAKSASKYFDKAKKLEAKIKRAGEVLKELEQKLSQKTEIEKPKLKEVPQVKEKDWYEKFHWFKLPDGRLVIGGRDATTNEILVKKHAEPNDLIFHAEVAGSPFLVVKTEGKEVPKEWLEAIAQATVSYSRAWKMRLGLAEGYWVTPDQVSKQAPAGEYMGKGAFMIRGRKTRVRSDLKIAIGWTGERVIGGPVDLIIPQSKKIIVVKPGYLKPSDVAKKAAKWFGTTDLDEIVAFLPAGESDIVESKSLTKQT